MSIRIRFVLTLGLFSLIISLVAVLSVRRALVNTALQADRAFAHATLDRALHILEDHEKGLLGAASDWATWDDTYEFTATRTPEYVAANLVEDALHDLHVDLICLCDLHGAIVACVASTGTPISLPSWLTKPLKAPTSSAIEHESTHRRSGLFLDGQTVWMGAAAPILTSEKKGPARGTLIMARRMDGDEIERLRRLIHPSFSLAAASIHWPVARRELRPVAPNALVARTVVADGSGRQRILLDMTLPRNAFAQVARGLALITAWIAASAAGLLLLSVVVMDRWILRSLMESVAALRSGMSQRPTYLPPRTVERPDEIGVLARTVQQALTELEQSQARLRESEAHYRELVEALPEALAGLDGDQRIVFCNRAMVAFCAVSNPKQMQDRGLADVLSPELAAAIRSAQAGHGPSEPYELPPVRITKANGTGTWVSVLLAPIRIPGVPKAVSLLCLRDITARQRAEEEADRRRAEAIRAQRLAALGTLVAGMAHEVNNPNTVIRINMQVLRQQLSDKQTTPESPPQSEASDILTIVDETLAASDRIAALVHALRQFSQSEPQATPPKRVRLNTIVEEAIRWTRHAVQEKCGNVLFEPACDEWIMGQPWQLQQVIINLIQNACDAAHSGSPVIRIRTALADGNRAAVIVQDNGPGIPAEIQEHLFDPFFTTRRSQGGLGLGLSISAAIAKSHGGTITISSKPSHGTTATLLLPLSDSEPRR